MPNLAAIRVFADTLPVAFVVTDNLLYAEQQIGFTVRNLIILGHEVSVVGEDTMGAAVKLRYYLDHMDNVCLDYTE